MRMKRVAPLIVALAGIALLGLFAGVSVGGRSPAALPGVRAASPAAQAPSAGEAQPVAPEVTHRRFSMIAVGDIMTDRNVGKAIAANGVTSILEKVRDLTRDADVSFANLECPLSTVGPHAPQDCVFRARPETVKVLPDGGFDVVSLANNHTFNAGREGVLQTFDNLDKHGIKYCGGNRDRRGDLATVLEVGEGPVRVGFIAATDLSFEHGSYNKVAFDRANLTAQIQAARPLCDILCVSFHWGDEYQDMPNQRQKNTARAAIRAGADLVLGHHPHTLQGIEVYQGKPILYSMGNFVFDQREGERMESAIFKLEYTEGWGWQIMAKPVWIPRSRMGPIYPSAERRDKILQRLVRISKPLGTQLQVKDGKAWLRVPSATSAEASKGNNI